MVLGGDKAPLINGAREHKYDFASRRVKRSREPEAGAAKPTAYKGRKLPA